MNVIINNEDQAFFKDNILFACCWDTRLTVYDVFNLYYYMKFLQPVKFIGILKCLWYVIDFICTLYNYVSLHKNIFMFLLCRSSREQDRITFLNGIEQTNQHQISYLKMLKLPQRWAWYLIPVGVLSSYSIM